MRNAEGRPELMADGVREPERAGREAEVRQPGGCLPARADRLVAGCLERPGQAVAEQDDRGAACLPDEQGRARREECLDRMVERTHARHRPRGGRSARGERRIEQHAGAGEGQGGEQLLPAGPRAGGGAAVAELRRGQRRRDRDMRQRAGAVGREARPVRADDDSQLVELGGVADLLSETERGDPRRVDCAPAPEADNRIDILPRARGCGREHSVVRRVPADVGEDGAKPAVRGRAQPLHERRVACRRGRDDGETAPRADRVERVAEPVQAAAAGPHGAGRRVAERSGRGAHASFTQTFFSCE